MIKIEKTDIFGWESAIRGMRNPLNSWSKGDTEFYRLDFDDNSIPYYELMHIPKIGNNDLNLMQRLANAGSDHAKFLRMINVTCDIVAPLYWWKEYDTYKVGTVANSCSTMHKIAEKEFTLEDFSYEHLITQAKNKFENVVDTLNGYRDIYINWEKQDELIQRAFEYNKKQAWWQMIQLLPSSYNQKRTVQLNYQVLLNIYHSRKNHKLDEWHTFCDWIERLPYFKEICLSNNKED